jgi:hypothetical protein
MLSGMSRSGKGGRGSPRKPAAKRKPSSKAGAGSSKRGRSEGDGFIEAFTALLRARKIPVPKGFDGAPPEAYASQPASFVDQLERLPDSELKRFAEKVAGYAKRQQERADAEWERSPLIAEIRRRKLKEPARPPRPVGVSVSLAKPLAEWSDKELLHAATEWSRIGRT